MEIILVILLLLAIAFGPVLLKRLFWKTVGVDCFICGKHTRDFLIHRGIDDLKVCPECATRLANKAVEKEFGSECKVIEGSSTMNTGAPEAFHVNGEAPQVRNAEKLSGGSSRNKEIKPTDVAVTLAQFFNDDMVRRADECEFDDDIFKGVQKRDLYIACAAIYFFSYLRACTAEAVKLGEDAEVLVRNELAILLAEMAGETIADRLEAADDISILVNKMVQAYHEHPNGPISPVYWACKECEVFVKGDLFVHTYFHLEVSHAWFMMLVELLKDITRKFVIVP